MTDRTRPRFASVARSWLAVLLGFRLSNQKQPLATRMIRLKAGVVERLKSSPMAAKTHMASGMRWGGGAARGVLREEFQARRGGGEDGARLGGGGGGGVRNGEQQGDQRRKERAGI